MARTTDSDLSHQDTANSAWIYLTDGATFFSLATMLKNGGMEQTETQETLCLKARMFGWYTLEVQKENFRSEEELLHFCVRKRLHNGGYRN